MRKKLVLIIGVVLATFLTACSSEYSDKLLVNFAESNNVSCIDDTEGYSHVDGAVVVKSVITEDTYIEFWEFDSKDSAYSWKESYTKSLLNNDGIEEIDNGYLLGNDYYKITQSGKTCYYVRGASKDIVDSTLTTLGVK